MGRRRFDKGLDGSVDQVCRFHVQPLAAKIATEVTAGEWGRGNGEGEQSIYTSRSLAWKARRS